MNAFDLIVLVVLILLALRGWMKGMVSQIVSVGSYIVCWIVASRFSFLIAPSIPAEAPWNKVGAMIILFIVTMIAIRFAHSVIEKWIKDLHMKEFDRFLGAFLGFVKGVFVCMVLTFFGVMLSEVTQQVVFESKSGNAFVRLIDKTGAFIPEDSCKLLRVQLEKFDAKVNGTTNVSSSTQYAWGNSAGQTGTEGNGGFSGLLSRGSELLKDAQSFRDDLNKETGGAVSLLDSVSKWWNGEKSSAQNSSKSDSSGTSSGSNLFNGGGTGQNQGGTASAPDSVIADLVQKAKNEIAGPLLKAEEELRGNAKSRNLLPNSAHLARPDATTPLKDEFQALVQHVPTSSSPQPFADQSQNLLPNSTTQRGLPSPPSSFQNSPSPIVQAESIPYQVPEAVQAMAIPQSASNFIPKPTADHPMRAPENLLDATRGNGADVGATLFSSPKRQKRQSSSWDPKAWAGALKN